ncbi:unnamed protein product [Scytosiphon promiscuus]
MMSEPSERGVLSPLGADLARAHAGFHPRDFIFTLATSETWHSLLPYGPGH